MINLADCYVLVVESNYNAAVLMQLILEEHEADSVIVPSIKKATQVLDKIKFDIIFSSHVLCDGNIKDLICHIEKHEELRNVPIVCLADNLPDGIVNIYPANVKKVLVKPFEVEELTETVKSLVLTKK